MCHLSLPPLYLLDVEDTNILLLNKDNIIDTM